jgi:hypothetical protein
MSRLTQTEETLFHISEYYGEELFVGRRLEYTNTQGIIKTGAICGAKGHYIKIQFDEDRKPYKGVFHPKSSIKYL